MTSLVQGSTQQLYPHNRTYSIRTQCEPWFQQFHPLVHCLRLFSKRRSRHPKPTGHIPPLTSPAILKDFSLDPDPTSVVGIASNASRGARAWTC